MNSLYGRFGMRPEMEKHLILPSSLALKYHKDYDINNVINLGDNKELISFFDKKIVYDGRKINVSVGIASAVTSYARIYMNQFKTMFNELGITLYYSDTDSFYIDQYLDTKFVGTGLG
jgi:DNA polymerase elongation subunit (family B)